MEWSSREVESSSGVVEWSSGVVECFSEVVEEFSEATNLVWFKPPIWSPTFVSTFLNTDVLYSIVLENPKSGRESQKSI